MATENENHLFEARLFVRTILHNVRVCYLQKIFNMNWEFASCKLYSKYCHDVILRYVDLNDGIFDELEKEYTQMLQHPHLKESIEIKLEKWVQVEEPSDSDLYIYFAKAAILALIRSSYDPSVLGKYEERETRYAVQAIGMGVLCENYDIIRYIWKTSVHAVYKWFGKSLVFYATELDIQHGWNESDLSSKGKFYFYFQAPNLLREWLTSEFYKEMNKLKFLIAIYEMYLNFKGMDNLTRDKKIKFTLSASLLSLYCCIHGNFSQAAEYVVDVLMRINGKNWTFFSINEIKAISVL